MADNSLVSAIFAATSDYRTRLALLTGAGMEGGLSGPWTTGNAGDQGTSFGPFQIHKVGQLHSDISVSDALNPATAVRYMLSAYQAAVAQVPDALWQTNPSKAAATAAYLAERPAAFYAPTQIAPAFSQAMQILDGAGDAQPTPQPGTGVPGSSEPAYPTSNGPGGTSNQQVATQQYLQAQQQGASNPALSNDSATNALINPYILNVPLPFGGTGQVDLSGPARLLWLFVGLILIIVGLFIINGDGVRKVINVAAKAV